MSKRGLSGGSQARSKRSKKIDIDESDSDDSVGNESIQDTNNSVVESSQMVPVTSTDMEEPIAGVVRRISLSNFMCHNRLEVKLGSHVNFIIGRNGSGKSAIVTALVVGLGGKATTTSRGSSIKSFIKTGKRSAWVEVSLNNKGKDSYKHDQFGDTIIVRRKFTVDGSGSYALYSASGNLVSNKRSELARITDHFGIQVDNPVSILNQDTSRNFLHTKSAGDKFKFFMKATQLEQMSSHYEEVQRNKEIARQTISSKRQTLPDMRKEVKVWETKFKNLAAISDLKVKVNHLENELAWAIICQKERDLRPVEKSLRNEEAALPRFVDKVNEKKMLVDQLETQHKELEQRLIECGRLVKDLEPQLQLRKRELQQAKDCLNPISTQVKACDRELRSTQQERQQCMDRIEELKISASHDYEADRRQREEQINQLEKKLDGLMSKHKVTENDMEQYRSAVAKLKTDLAQSETALKSKQMKLREVKMSVRTLQSAKNDRLQRFGQWMPEVIKRIQARKRQFEKIPKGPLGACFDLKEPKWALAIEACLSTRLLSSFVCHNHRDEKLLEQVFKEVDCPRGARPTIITCPFSERVHDVSRERVQSRYPCVLDMIKYEDPVIINTLIDQRSIENVLLIENSSEAREVMMRRPPPKSRECFTLEGDQVYCVPTFRYYSSDKTTVKLLMANVEDQILKLQQEEHKLEAEVAASEKQRDNLHQEIAKNQQEERKCRTQLNHMAESISPIQFEINELRNVEDPAPVDVTTLEEEVEAYNKKLEELKGQREAVLEEKKVAEAQLEEAKKNYAEVESEIREKSDNGIPLREEVSQIQVDIENGKANLKHYKTKLKEQEQKISSLKKQVEKFKAELEKDQKKASEICDRVHTERVPDSIENEITQIKRRITEEEEQQGNEEEITETYRVKKETYEKIKWEVHQQEQYIEKLDEVMEKRQIAYQKMRKSIANRTKYFFLMQMYLRSFKGKMVFDFGKQTLEIMVNTTEEGAKGKSNIGESKDLKSLSGGERSFSTVCFILSLWEAMESPFRCLDEFDVFMDMVNRRVSMDMMMEAADMHKGMQFIFLTPQDMSSVRKISNVRIFRMSDPERGQSTLPFTQQSQG